MLRVKGYKHLEYRCCLQPFLQHILPEQAMDTVVSFPHVVPALDYGKSENPVSVNVYRHEHGTSMILHHAQLQSKDFQVSKLLKS